MTMSRTLRISCAGLRLRKRDRAAQQIVRSAEPSRPDDVIDDAGGERLRRGDRLAVGAHLERHLRAGETRQPLRAAGAGNDAEHHFGLADPGVLGRDAEVAGLRDLEAAAERVAVNRGDERLGGVLDALEQRVRALGARHRIGRRLQQVERLDVRAGDERRAGADEHDRLGGRIGDAALDRLVDLSPDLGRQRVHRRVVDGHDGDAVFHFVPNEIRPYEISDF